MDDKKRRKIVDMALTFFQDEEYPLLREHLIPEVVFLTDSAVEMYSPLFRQDELQKMVNVPWRLELIVGDTEYTYVFEFLTGFDSWEARASHQTDTPDREHPAVNKGKSVAQLDKEYRTHRRAHPGR